LDIKSIRARASSSNEWGWVEWRNFCETSGCYITVGDCVSNDKVVGAKAERRAIVPVNENSGSGSGCGRDYSLAFNHSDSLKVKDLSEVASIKRTCLESSIKSSLRVLSDSGCVIY
jgi:hypothetical protein